MAVQAVSHFPQLAPLGADEAYASVIDKARANFANFDSFNTQADEVAPLAVTWGERHAKLIAGTVEPMPSLDDQRAELNTKLDLYIKYRKVRDDSLKITEIYDKTIEECAPPAVTKEVEDFLAALQKCKVKLTDLQGPFDRVFTTDVDQLKDQREKMAGIYKKILLPLQALCAKLEQLAFHCGGYSTGAHLALRAYEGSTTPLVKSMVRAREKAIADLLQQAQ